MTSWESEVDISFADESCQLHEQRQGQRQSVADWVFQGKEIWNIPHQEQDAKSTDGGFAWDTRKFIGVDNSAWRENEGKCGLQIPSGDESNQEAGSPNAHLSQKATSGIIINRHHHHHPRRCCHRRHRRPHHPSHYYHPRCHCLCCPIRCCCHHYCCHCRHCRYQRSRHWNSRCP